MSTATLTQKDKPAPILAIETVTCYICEDEIEKDEVYEFDGHYLCSDCLDDETFICERCGEREWREENAGDDDFRLCYSCYDDRYTRCEDCGVVISRDDVYYVDEDDEYGYCSYCCEKQRELRYIHDYSYKPEPIFHGDPATNRYFGVELEIDDGGKDNDHAYDLLINANRLADNIYIKGDGSLNDGMEIVTHPMTLDYHMTSMNWETLAERALDMGYKSHKTSTCGLHIHVNKNTFTDDPITQDNCISRVLFIVERFWQELLRFSRRTESQIRQWAARYGFKSDPGEILDAAKKSGYNRYTCVNLTNYSTIEFRIFKGTLKYTTIIATLQLVDYICNVAVSMCNATIEKLSWCDFVEGIDAGKYPELVRYMKERKIYINEPVETDEDE
jgi:hypothetical protein